MLILRESILGDFEFLPHFSDSLDKEIGLAVRTFHHEFQTALFFDYVR